MGELGGKLSGREALDEEAFLGLGLARDQGDAGGGDVESFGENFDDGVIGAAAFGWLGDLDLQGGAEDAGDGLPGGIGDDLHMQDAATGGGINLEGHRGTVVGHVHRRVNETCGERAIWIVQEKGHDVARRGAVVAKGDVTWPSA